MISVFITKNNCNTTFASAETDQTYQDNVEKITKKVIDRSVTYFLIILTITSTLIFQIILMTHK